MKDFFILVIASILHVSAAFIAKNSHVGVAVTLSTIACILIYAVGYKAGSEDAENFKELKK